MSKQIAFVLAGLITAQTAFAAATIPQGDEAVCSSLSEALAPLSEPGASASAAASIAAKKPKLIVIGEAHYEHYFWKLPEIYKLLKKQNPEIDCLFTEFSQDVTEQEFADVLEGKPSRVYYTPVRLGFAPLYQSVLAQGDRVIGVDAPYEVVFDPELRKNIVKWLTVRDDFMLQRIEKAFASGECKAAVYNIGVGHIIDYEDPQGKYVSFGTKLRASMKSEVAFVSQVFEYFNENLCNFTEAFYSGGFQSFLTVKEKAPAELLPFVEPLADYVLFLRPDQTVPALFFNDYPQP